MGVHKYIVIFAIFQTVIHISTGKYIFGDVFNDPVRDTFINERFPEGFIWGVGTSAYQIEGGWDADGKGLSIWDTFTHTPDKIHQTQNGDVACDSYYNYKEDIEMIKQLGVSHYRLSLSWVRLLPTGFANQVNKAGVKYYHDVIDALLAAGVQPAVTLYHSDLPQALEDIGGWQNEMMVVYFNEYADFCFKEFGEKVKLWFTINQPKFESINGYEVGVMAPGKTRPGYGAYRAIHTMLKAHARAWHTYDLKYRAEQQGKISIVINSLWSEPATDGQADKAAADRALLFDVGITAHPIYGNGDYPQIIKNGIGDRSRAQGLTLSRLPSFTDEERRFIEGTADFFALNHYTTRYIKHKNAEETRVPNINDDIGVEVSTNSSWPAAASPSFKMVPWGLRRLLRWIKKNYGDIPIYITENGVPEPDGPMNLDDELRSKYYQAYINEALKASHLDGVNLQGYFAWTLMDNFEWTNGYSQRVGLYHVDFNDPKRTRRAKTSAKTYTRIVRDNGFISTPERKVEL